MGSVYLAEQISMGREVALKILAPELTRNETFRNRFEQEIRLQAALNHPNIATAYDAGHDGAVYYLIMEYMDGLGLDEIVRKNGPFSEKAALRIIRKVAVGLSYAWKTSSLIHRDVKPSNIMMDDSGKVKVLDMGVSKSLKNDEGNELSTQFIVGTPQYMSPEQMRGAENLDHRADIYALGATLYHMVTGQAPFPHKSLAKVVEVQAQGPAPNPRDLNPDISSACIHLIRVMMAVKPDHRYSYWSSLIADISRVLSGHKPMTRTPNKDESMVSSVSTRSKDKALRINPAELRTKKPSDPSSESAPAAPQTGLLVGVGLLVTLALMLMIMDASRPDPVREPKAKVEVAASKDPTNIQEEIALVLAEEGVTGDALLAQAEDPVEEPPQLQDLYTFITNRMEQFPQRFTDHQEAVDQLRIDAEFYGFSRYSLLAEELTEDLTRRRTAAMASVIGALSDAADQYWLAGEYGQSVDVWTQYEGELAEETAKERSAKATEFRQREVERVRLEAAKKKQAVNAVGRLVNTAADQLLSGAPLTDLKQAVEQARETFDDKKVKKRLGNLLFSLDVAEQMDQRILDLFVPEIGSIITLDTRRGSVPVAVVDVTNGLLYVERQLEQGSLGLVLKVEDLSLREKMQRLQMSEDSNSAFRQGLLALQERDFAAALDFLKKDSSELSTVLISRIHQMVNVEPTIRDKFEDDPESHPKVRTLKRALAKVNPKYRGGGEFRLQDGRITGVNLQAAGDEISDLGPLKGRPIESLGLAGAGIRDLKPLAGMPLKILILLDANIRTLAPLEGMELIRLSIQGASQIRSISALTGMPLEALDLRGTRVADLSPVQGAPLASLMLGSESTTVHGLGQFPLVHLDISGSKVESLDDLASSTVQSLYMVDTPVRDVKALKDVPLEQIRFDPRFIVGGLNELRSIETLQRIADTLDGDSLPASVFWGHFDRGFYQKHRSRADAQEEGPKADIRSEQLN